MSAPATPRSGGTPPIRPVLPEDHPEWLRMRRVLWPEYEASAHALEMGAIAARPGERAAFVVDRGGGRLGGFIELSIRERIEVSFADPVGYVEGWYVDPDLRRLGVGRRLMERAEAWTLERGLTQLASDAEVANEPSIRAHRAAGFKETLRLAHFLKRLQPEAPPGAVTARGNVPFYDATYGGFASEVYAAIRAETFGEDLGQNGWLTADEQDLFLDWLQPGPDAHLLDVACGSGGPTLRIARRSGCRVHGVDLHPGAVDAARRQAAAAGLSDRGAFEVADASRPLPLPDGSFDLLICIDAINHLPDRAAVLADWSRLLRPGGRLLFTDPIVLAGPVTHEEIAARAAIGFFLFVPPGLDETLIGRAGLRLLHAADRTENVAQVAEAWCRARAARAADLRRIEGEATFAGQQRFLEVAARLARERRLARMAFCAERPAP